MSALLITGAAGFIGGHFTRLLSAARPQLKIVALDKLTYAGDLTAIRPLIDTGRIEFVHGDICDGPLVGRLLQQHTVRQIVNFAAETHVDRSIAAGSAFVMSNVVGVQVLLDAARRHGVERFIQISTDEVYGSLPEDRPDLKFTEDSPLLPNSPYSASKAAADCLVRAAFQTHHLPAIITRASNNYGPYQFPEKIIPLFVSNLLQDRRVPLYGDGLNIRDWLAVEDHCAALLRVLDDGRPGETYNIAGGHELTNRQLTEMILKAMNRSWDQSVELVADRPGHDRRYAVDSSKIERELHWRPHHDFKTAICRTIAWYVENEKWWREIQIRTSRSS